MSDREREQNKKINQHSRQINNLEQRVRTLELDVDADGRISEGFNLLENHLDEVDQKLTKRLDEQAKKMDRLSRDMNEVKASLNTILENITGISDLPEE